MDSPNSRPGVAIYDGDNSDDFFEQVYQRFMSRQYWIIISDPANSKLSEFIENVFYKPGTKANDDFHLAFDIFTYMIIFAKKSRMSHQDLIWVVSKVYNKKTYEEFKATTQKDKDMIVMPSKMEAYEQIMPFLQDLYSYFERRELV